MNNNNNSTEESGIQEKKKKNKYSWTIKITVITFVIAGLFRFISDVATSKSNLIIAIFIILLFILIGIVTDGIAVAVTSCDIAPFLSMASKKVASSKAAINLVKNADKVSSICADVVGDICGIISGACSVVVVSKILATSQSVSESVLTIAISSLVAALTVGGKAFGKALALKYNKEYVLATAKVLSVFQKKDKK